MPLRNTVLLAGFGYAISLPLSLTIGTALASGRRARRRAGTLVSSIGNILYGLPAFVLALWLVDLAYRAFG